MFDLIADQAPTARATVAPATRVRPYIGQGHGCASRREPRPVGRPFAFGVCAPNTVFGSAVTDSTWTSTGSIAIADAVAVTVDPMGNATDLGTPTRYLRTRNVRTT